MCLLYITCFSEIPQYTNKNHSKTVTPDISFSRWKNRVHHPTALLQFRWKKQAKSCEMKQVNFVWETSSYDWFEAYVEKIEGMEKKENFWLWMCYQSACSKKLGLFPGKEKWAEILFFIRICQFSAVEIFCGKAMTLAKFQRSPHLS